MPSRSLLHYIATNIKTKDIRIRDGDGYINLFHKNGYSWEYHIQICNSIDIIACYQNSYESTNIEYFIFNKNMSKSMITNFEYCLFSCNEAINFINQIKIGTPFCINCNIALGLSDLDDFKNLLCITCQGRGSK